MKSLVFRRCRQKRPPQKATRCNARVAFTPTSDKWFIFKRELLFFWQNLLPLRFFESNQNLLLTD